MEEKIVSPPIRYALIVCTSCILITDIMLLQIQVVCVLNIFSLCSNSEHGNQIWFPIRAKSYIAGWEIISFQTGRNSMEFIS
jgi:hypothetical protein